MKTTFFLLSILFLIANPTRSQWQWTEQTSGVLNQLFAVSAVDSSFVWIAAANGRIFRTTNGGSNWSNALIPGIPGGITFVSIFGIDSLTCLATGSTPSGTYLYRTSNAGASWSLVLTQSSGFLDAIWFWDNQNGYIVGDPVQGRWSLWRTYDGGVSWDSSGLYMPRFKDEAGCVNSLSVIGANMWFGSGQYYHIYHSIDSGKTFTQQTAPGDTAVYAVKFNSVTEGICAMSLTINSTSNGGMNWISQNSLLAGTIYTITGSGSEYWYINRSTVSNGQIFYSSNSGQNFVQQYAPVTGYYNHIAQSRTGRHIWAVGNGGRISKYGPPSIGIKNITSEIPLSFSLSQNYPNPFNPTTKIRFALPAPGLRQAGLPPSPKGEGLGVRVTVYDISGRLIETIVNQNLKPGKYEVEWSAANYSSGVYYYRLIAGDYIDTKKMILIK